jgi:hypothetical protein
LNWLKSVSCSIRDKRSKVAKLLIAFETVLLKFLRLYIILKVIFKFACGFKQFEHVRDKTIHVYLSYKCKHVNSV